MSEILVFIISLLVPAIFWRGLFFINRQSFKKPFWRTRTKYKVHHLHHGIIVVLIATIGLLFFGKNIYEIILFGLGLGMIMDLFIPSLLIETDRNSELEIYEKNFINTIVLFAVIIFVILIAYFLLK